MFCPQPTSTSLGPNYSSFFLQEPLNAGPTSVTVTAVEETHGLASTAATSPDISSIGSSSQHESHVKMTYKNHELSTCELEETSCDVATTYLHHKIFPPVHKWIVHHPFEMAHLLIKVVSLRHWKMIQEVKTGVYELTVLPTFITTQAQVHRCHALLLPTRGVHFE